MCLYWCLRIENISDSIGNESVYFLNRQIKLCHFENSYDSFISLNNTEAFLFVFEIVSVHVRNENHLCFKHQKK